MKALRIAGNGENFNFSKEFGLGAIMLAEKQLLVLMGGHFAMYSSYIYYISQWLYLTVRKVASTSRGPLREGGPV